MLLRNTTVSLLGFRPTSAAQRYRRLCQTSIWVLVSGLQLCFFLLVGTQQCHPFTAGARFFPVGAAGSRSATHTHAGILHWDVNAQAWTLPEYSQKEALQFSQLALTFARFCITLSLADKSQLGCSCSLTTEMGPISP